eukprot:10929306-Alexandrium_andersonii.AAC.1
MFHSGEATDGESITLNGDVTVGFVAAGTGTAEPLPKGRGLPATKPPKAVNNELPMPRQTYDT